MSDFSSLLSRNPEQVMLSRASGCLSTPVDDETVLLNIDTGVYSSLDPVGSRIWQRLTEPVSLAGLIRMILEEYEVEEEQCVADLHLFLAELHDKQLIEITS